VSSGTKRITSWSFSRYTTYRECPYRAKLKFIDKLKEPGNKYMDRGTEIHQQAEDFIKGKKRVVPKDLVKVGEFLKTCRDFFKKKKNEADAVCEDTWAFTHDWQKTVWDDWARCVVRIKLDFAHVEVIPGKKPKKVLIITDWKTGKFREQKNEEYLEQLDLYALAGLLIYPDVDEVWPQLVYTDHNFFYPKTSGEIRYTHKDLKGLKLAWHKRTSPMLRDTRFAPRPGAYCKNCHFRKDNSGPCQY
jgi:hypothetical protein